MSTKYQVGNTIYDALSNNFFKIVGIDTVSFNKHKYIMRDPDDCLIFVSVAFVDNDSDISLKKEIL